MSTTDFLSFVYGVSVGCFAIIVLDFVIRKLIHLATTFDHHENEFYCPNCHCGDCAPDDLDHLATELSNHTDQEVR